jgi:photosystem II stability/assembly factor-like uncharacterized protein
MTRIMPFVTLLVLSVASESHVCAAATEALVVEGGGIHWEFAGWEGGGAYPALEFDHEHPGRVYLGSDVAGIWRSDDYGDSWLPATTGLGNSNVAVIAVAPSDTGVVYAGTAGGLYVSRDAGLSWQAADTISGKMKFARPSSYRSIAISRANPARVCAGSSAGIVACSNNFGASWQVLGPDYGPFGESHPVTALSFSKNESVLWAASSEGLARYAFSGEHWEPLRGTPKPVTDFIILGTESEMLIAAGQKALQLCVLYC